MSRDGYIFLYPFVKDRMKTVNVRKCGPTARWTLLEERTKIPMRIMFRKYKFTTNIGMKAYLRGSYKRIT